MAESSWVHDSESCSTALVILPWAARAKTTVPLQRQSDMPPISSSKMLLTGDLVGMNRKQLSERDICTKFIGPAITAAGWDIQRQVREEVSFTKGRIIVRGKMHSRGKSRRADFIMYHQPNTPLAVIEAKDNTHTVGDGMQQALDYADVEYPPTLNSIQPTLNCGSAP